jgi:hypothetical protein
MGFYTILLNKYYFLRFLVTVDLTFTLLGIPVFLLLIVRMCDFLVGIISSYG